MCVQVCERARRREREREEKWKGQGHINKDLANIMIMFGHSPELLLAGSQTPKQTEIEGKLSGSDTLSFQAKKEHLISHLWQAEEPFGEGVGGVLFKIYSEKQITLGALEYKYTQNVTQIQSIKICNSYMSNFFNTSNLSIEACWFI